MKCEEIICTDVQKAYSASANTSRSESRYSHVITIVRRLFRMLRRTPDTLRHAHDSFSSGWSLLLYANLHEKHKAVRERSRFERELWQRWTWQRAFRFDYRNIEIDNSSRNIDILIAVIYLFFFSNMVFFIYTLLFLSFVNSKCL